MPEHVDELWIPPSPDTNDDTIIRAKAQTKVQTLRGVFQRIIDQFEYWTRSQYDYLDEVIGTINGAAAPTVIKFPDLIKYIEIDNLSTSTSSLFANLQGGRPFNTASATVFKGTLQIRAGESRKFFVPIYSIQIINDGTNSTTYRITIGY